MNPNGQHFSKIMHACHEAFALYHLILEKKKNNTVQETLDQFLIKKHIEQQQPESAADADDPQPCMAAI